MLRLIDDALHVAGEVDWPRVRRQAWHKRVRVHHLLLTYVTFAANGAMIYSWCENMDESEDERSVSNDKDPEENAKVGNKRVLER